MCKIEQASSFCDYMAPGSGSQGTARPTIYQIALGNRIEIGVTDPLPAVRSFFPHAQPGRRPGRQMYLIDGFVHRNLVGHYDIVAVNGCFEVAQRELTEFEILNQRNLAGSVTRSIRMNRLKTFCDFALYCFPFLRFEISPHLSFHFFAVDELIIAWFHLGGDATGALSAGQTSKTASFSTRIKPVNCQSWMKCDACSG
jgi:hypothetical protein